MISILIALGGCTFVALLGLAIGVLFHEVHEARRDREAPDYPFPLEPDHGND